MSGSDATTTFNNHCSLIDNSNLGQEVPTTTSIENKTIPKITRKKSKDDIEITEEQAKYLSEIPIPDEFKKKVLYCRIWNENGTKTIGKSKKITYGTPYFTMKVAGRKRFFKINYSVQGMIKNIDGKLYYDTTYDNTLGALALRNVEFPEDMMSEEAYTSFVNNAVNMYVKKGGIPLTYLLIAMAMVLVMGVAIIATVPSGMNAQKQVEELDKQVTVLKQQNAVLQQRLQTGGIQ